MGRFATNLAAYAANVDNLPPKDKLPEVSFWEAVLPTSVSDLLSDPTKVKKVRTRSNSSFHYFSCDQDFVLLAYCSGLSADGFTKEEAGNDGWTGRPRWRLLRLGLYGSQELDLHVLLFKDGGGGE